MQQYTVIYGSVQQKTMTAIRALITTKKSLKNPGTWLCLVHEETSGVVVVDIYSIEAL